MARTSLVIEQISQVQKTVGEFYTGDTTPSSSTRLNFDGYFYANNFYGTLQAGDVEIGDTEGFFS